MTSVFVLLSSGMSKEIGIVKDCTTDEKVRRFAKDIVRETAESGDTSQITKYITQKFEEAFDGKWGCIAGKKCSSYVNYCNNNYIKLKYGELSITIFQSKK